MKREVIFKEAGRTKSAVGYVIFDDGFIKVLDDEGRTIFVNNRNVVLIKDLEGEW